MNPEVLIQGMNFASEHNLTQKEIQALVPFLEESYTTLELSKKLGVHKTTLHHTLQRLKLKGLLTLKNRDEKGSNVYMFVLSQLNSGEKSMTDEETKIYDSLSEAEEKDSEEEDSEDSEDSEEEDSE